MNNMQHSWFWLNSPSLSAGFPLLCLDGNILSDER
jgi:hypothetical protein